MDTLRVAAVQLQSQDALAKNLDECRRLIGEARDSGAELVVLPENFAYFGTEDGKRSLAEQVPDSAAPIQAALANMAREAEIFLVAGGLPEASGDRARPHNAALAFAPDGTLVAHYRKIHLFDASLQDGTSLHESSATTAGAADGLAHFDIGRFRIGLSVCYDVRFPELYRALVDRGVNVLLVPSAFTVHTGRDHWHVLLRARAIESQAFVIAAAQWGKHPRGRSTYGHSLIVDPWGTVVAEASDQVGIVCATLDFGYLEQVRRSLPSLDHRRASAS